MSLVSQIISISDNELRYPSVGELEYLKNYFLTVVIAPVLHFFHFILFIITG